MNKDTHLSDNPAKMNIGGGWSWLALLFGPFLYLVNGLWKKGLFLLAIVIISVGLAAPFVWIYCAVKAKTDLYEQKLFDKSRFDIDKI